jgi:hypothetical protein
MPEVWKSRFIALTQRKVSVLPRILCQRGNFHSTVFQKNIQRKFSQRGDTFSLTEFLQKYLKYKYLSYLEFYLTKLEFHTPALHISV